MADPQKVVSQITTSKASVSPEELDIAFSGAAPFINKMYLSLTPVTARLSFAEIAPNGKITFRAAVAMAIADLTELKALIERTLQDT